MNKLYVGNQVVWFSAAGELTGKVVDIFLARNVNKELIAWITIETTNGYTVTLCGDESNLKMLKFAIISYV